MNTTELRNRTPLNLAAPCVTFPQPKVVQSHSVWCWAAVKLALLQLFHINQPSDICGVVHSVKMGCLPPCNDPGSCFKTADIVAVLQAPTALSATFVQLNATSLAQGIGTSDRIVSEVWEGSDSHLLIIRGYCAASDLITLMDPKSSWDQHLWKRRLFPEKRSFHVTKPPRILPGTLPQTHAAPGPISPALEPSGASLLIEQLLPAILPEFFSPARIADLESRDIRVGSGVPLQTWSSVNVLAGVLTTSFLGWRHLVFSGDEAFMAIDLTFDNEELTFKKASTGGAVAKIAEAMDKLASQEPIASEVELIEVPCLDLFSLSFQAPEEKVMVAYSLYHELSPLATLTQSNFIALAKDKAVEERVTDNV